MRLDEVEVDADWTAIRRGTLPCASCGLAVSVNADSEVELLEVPVGSSRFTDEGGIARVVTNTAELATTLCSECSLIRVTAGELLRANGGVRAAIGDPEIAAWRTELALLALDALGVRDFKVIDKLTSGPTAILRLIGALAAPGGAARWAARARALRSKAPSMPASSRRWAHVTAEQRRALNEARVGMFVRDNERPAPVAALDDDGKPTACMLCGVGAVMALPSHASKVWNAMEADSETIGGRIAPEPVEGVVCGRCDSAIDRAGGIGSTAMVLSVRDFLGLPRHVRSMEHIDGLVGWAVTGRRANAEAWEHLDLDPVRREMELIGIRPNERMP